MWQSMTESSDHKRLAKLLEQVSLETAARIVAHIPEGRYAVLPFLTRVWSLQPTVDKLDLTMCSRVTVLILPNCINLTDNVLMMLPNLESLTIKVGNSLTSDAFKYLNYLTRLQILSHGDEVEMEDTLLNFPVLRYLDKLEMLHVRSSSLRDEHFRLLPNLKVLILYGNKAVSRAIIDFLPKLEILLLNGTLCKFVATANNNQIIRRIGRVDNVQI